MTWFQYQSLRATVRMKKEKELKAAGIGPGIKQVLIIITCFCPPLSMFLNLVITENKLSGSFRQVLEKLLHSF